MKKCPRCEETKDAQSFYPKQTYCIVCSKEVSYAWRNREGNREKHNTYSRLSQIKKKYNLTKEEYAALIEKGCQICGSAEGLCVDHDHACCPGKTTCGKCVRGILCRRHNFSIGLLEDLARNGESVDTLYEYLGLAGMP